MSNELVSVIITAFNEEHFIKQTIDSYLCQSYKNLEIIVVNDGSTDNTANILNSYAVIYPNLKVIHFQENRGKVIAQNAAFVQTQGEYIAISGGDDFGCYSRIKSQVDYIKKTQTDFVFSNLYIIDEKNHCLEYKPVFFDRYPPIAQDVKDAILGWGVPGGTLLFTRNLAKNIYPIPVNLLYEDRWFSFIASIYGKIGYIHEPLGFYRQSNNNSYGLIKYQPYSNFREKYIYIYNREVINLKEIKKYLIDHKMWNSELEAAYYYRQNFVLLLLAKNLRKRINLLSELQGNKSFKHILLFLLGADIAIIPEYIKTNIKVLFVSAPKILRSFFRD